MTTVLHHLGHRVLNFQTCFTSPSLVTDDVCISCTPAYQLNRWFPIRRKDSTILQFSHILQVIYETFQVDCVCLSVQQQLQGLTSGGDRKSGELKEKCISAVLCQEHWQYQETMKLLLLILLLFFQSFQQVVSKQVISAYAKRVFDNYEKRKSKITKKKRKNNKKRKNSQNLAAKAFSNSVLKGSEE